MNHATTKIFKCKKTFEHRKRPRNDGHIDLDSICESRQADKNFMQYVVAFGNFGAASSISFHIPAAQGQIFFQTKESIGVGVRGL